jgi:hypothetical protein
LSFSEAVTTLPFTPIPRISIFSSESDGLVILRIRSSLLVEAEIVGNALTTNLVALDVKVLVIVLAVFANSTVLILNLLSLPEAFRLDLMAIVCFQTSRVSFNQLIVT